MIQDLPSDYSTPFTVKLHEDSFRSYKCDAPELELEVTRSELLHLYKTMQLMRRLAMASDALYKAKLIRGFCHLATGQVRCSAPLEPVSFSDCMCMLGSGLRRHGSWDQARRPAHHSLSLSFICGSPWGKYQRRHRRAPRSPSGHVQRKGWGNAHLHANVLRREWDRRGTGTSGSWSRLCAEVHWIAERLLRALWRWCEQPRASLRSNEHGKARFASEYIAASTYCAPFIR